MLIGYPGERPLPGEVRRELRGLVDGGVARILDALLVVKSPDGTFAGHEARELVGELMPEAAAGLLGGEDAAAAAAVLEPGQAGLLLMYEPCWTARLAGIVGEAGGQLVDMGSIRVGDVLDGLRRTEGG
jgi:hypothetical protein